MPPVSLFYFLFLSAQSLGHRGHKNTFFRRLIISQIYQFYPYVLLENDKKLVKFNHLR